MPGPNERAIILNYHIPGTLSADSVQYAELPFPWVASSIKAVGSNANSGRISLKGGVVLAAGSGTYIGDSGNPTEISLSDTQVDADEVVIIYFDYYTGVSNGARNVTLTLLGYIGEAA